MSKAEFEDMVLRVKRTLEITSKVHPTEPAPKRIQYACTVCDAPLPDKPKKCQFHHPLCDNCHTEYTQSSYSLQVS